MAKVNDPHAPNYVLIINGKLMNSAFMGLVKSVNFEDESELISSLNFTMTYQQNTLRGVSKTTADMKFVSPGNLVILKGGYGTDLVEIGAGYITDIQPNFSGNEEPTIKVVCYDQLQKLSLAKSEKGQVFKNLRDSQIASTLGERNGFYIRTADSSTFFGIRYTKSGKNIRTQKRGSSDLDFLKELAKLNAYDVFCKWDKDHKRFAMFFEPPRDRTTAVMTFVYGDGTVPLTVREINGVLKGTLKSFQPKISITSQFTKYKVNSWDIKSEKKINHTMSMSEFIGGQDDLKFGGFDADALLGKDSAISGASVRGKAFKKDTVEVLSTRTFKSTKEAKEYLKNHMKKIAKDFITGTGTISGNQYLQSRQIHKLEGLSAFFNRKYFLKKVTHTFDNNGYNCSISVRTALKEEI